MDTCTADVTNMPMQNLEPGDSVELIGPNQSVSELAVQLETAPHALLTGLGRRFERRFSGRASPHA